MRRPAILLPSCVVVGRSRCPAVERRNFTPSRDRSRPSRSLAGRPPPRIWRIRSSRSAAAAQCWGWNLDASGRIESGDTDGQGDGAEERGARGEAAGGPARAPVMASRSRNKIDLIVCLPLCSTRPGGEGNAKEFKRVLAWPGTIHSSATLFVCGKVCQGRYPGWGLGMVCGQKPSTEPACLPACHG